MKRFLKIFSSVLVSLVFVLAFLIAGVRIFGLQVYTILSPSMEPHYPTGALIYVRSADPADLEVGDVITFMISKEICATHRIIEILPDENNPDLRCFRTKGDANLTEDTGIVLEANILGKPVFTISYLGYVASFIQNPPGMYLSIAIGLILVILVFMLDMMTTENKPKEK